MTQPPENLRIYEADVQPTKLELRQYSRDQDAEYEQSYVMPKEDSRQKIASFALSRRALARQDSERILQAQRTIVNEESRVQSLEEERSQTEEEYQITEREIQQIGDFIQNQETNLAKKVMALIRPGKNNRRREELEGQMEDLVQRRLSLNNEILHYKQLIEIRLQVLSDQKEYLQQYETNRSETYESGLKYIDDYYEKLRSQWHIDTRATQDLLELEDYKRGQGQVRDRILGEGHWLVHGVIPSHHIGFANNKLMSNQAGYDERMTYALTVKPTLCGSSFKDSSEQPITLWNNFGLVMNQGMIEDALMVDAGSQVDDQGGRTRYARTIDGYESSLAASLDKGSIGRYNEIIVSNPESVACFINLDQVNHPNQDTKEALSIDTILWNKGVRGEDYQQLTIGDIMDTTQVYGLPLILFEKGNGYLADISLRDLGQISKGRAVTPQEVAEWRWEPSESMRSVEELSSSLSDNPLSIV